MSGENGQSSLPTGPIVVRSGESPSYSLSPTDRYSFPFAGYLGQPEVFDAHLGKGDGTPMHRHPWGTWEIVVEGRVRFCVAGEEFVLGPGDFAYTPPNAPHAFVVDSDTARMIGINHPSGPFAELTRKAVPLFRAEGGPDMDAIAKLAAEHQVEVVGPPLAPA